MTIAAYPYYFRNPSEIPIAVYSNLHREIGAAVGKSVSEIFPEFAKAFPLTVSCIERNWPAPILACDFAYGEWLVCLVAEKSDANLFFNLTPADVEMYGSRFEKSHRMLPEKWRELYRWFWSFVITPDARRPLFWKNTPFSYPSRLSLEEFRQKIGGKKAEARAFEERVAGGKADLKCWMWTEAGDALFLDENAKDQVVYHVRNNDLNDIDLLKAPEEALDKYLAHIVSGRVSNTFVFR